MFSSRSTGGSVDAPVLHCCQRSASQSKKDRKYYIIKISSSHLGNSGTSHFQRFSLWSSRCLLPLNSTLKQKTNTEITFSFRDRVEPNDIFCLLVCVWVQWLGCSLSLRPFLRWSAAEVLRGCLIKGRGLKWQSGALPSDSCAGSGSASDMLRRTRSLLLGLTLKLNHQPRANV